MPKLPVDLSILHRCPACHSCLAGRVNVPHHYSSVPRSLGIFCQGVQQWPAVRVQRWIYKGRIVISVEPRSWPADYQRDWSSNPSSFALLIIFNLWQLHSPKTNYRHGYSKAFRRQGSYCTAEMQSGGPRL